MHTGAPGDGPQLPGGSISGVPLRGSAIQGVTLTGVTGSSTDVSTQLSGNIASTGITVEGVVVTAPYNNVILRNVNGSEFDDGSGNLVYGRVTNSGSTWTLSYYSLVATVETPYTFASSTSIIWYYQQLFNPIVDAPTYSDLFFTPSDNATADIVDASETQSGKVALANTAPPAIASASVKGVATRVAKADHTHEGVHSLAIDGIFTEILGDVLLESGTGITLSYDGSKIKISLTGGGTFKVEYRTVSSGEASAKQLTLGFTPVAPTEVMVDTIGGVAQFYGDDFTVSGNVLNWSGLGMDSLPITTGDKLRIAYTY